MNRRPLRWKPATRRGRHVTVARWIVEQVKEALLAGDLRSGDFLGTEQDLAGIFEVSRIAARDALKALEALGIVISRPGPGGGARIAEGNPDRFAEALAIQLTLIAVTEDEIFVGQKAIEVMAAAEAARMATPDDIARLQNLIEEAVTHIADPARFKQLSWDFHHAITVASKNRVLISLRNSIVDVLPGAYIKDLTRDRAQSVIRCHRRLLKFIREGDEAGARNEMLEHVDDLHQSITQPRALTATAAARPRAAKSVGKRKGG